MVVLSLYHRSNTVVSWLYHRCITVVSSLYQGGSQRSIVHKEQKVGGGGGVIQLVTMQMTDRPTERKLKRTHIDK